MCTLSFFQAPWIKEIIDLPLPDTTLAENREQLRKKHELDSFKEEHYLADLVQMECVQPFVSFESEWDAHKEVDVSLSDAEKDILKELPNKEYLMDENMTRCALFGMVDILFASCYNHRTTLGEHTVESGWTINKLSSTLCWLQVQSRNKRNDNANENSHRLSENVNKLRVIFTINNR